MNLSDNALTIFNNLYSFQDESVEDTFKRVAKEFATNDEEEGLAYSLLSDNIWRPNTPVFLNAGTEHRNFCACHVVGLEDSMESIYDVANVSRKIFQYGAGVGIPIGNLREKEAFIFEGNPLMAPEGKSSGPIVFMRLYDAVGDTTKSGGRVRRAAIMVSMYVWHPDIMEFIQCKQNEGWLTNMNISVAITDKFMQSLEDKTPFQLYSPQDGTEKGTINPEELWDTLSVMAHKTGDPGVLFLDTVQKHNPLKKKFLIESTNPCGEQPLMPFGVCNLSAINISKFVEGDDFNWDGLYRTAYNITGLMDNIIDTMDYPDPRFKDTAQKYRQIGIGMMGLADAMYMLNYRYDGPEGKKFAAEIMRTITTASVDRSTELAEEKGAFFECEEYKDDLLEILSQQIGKRKVLKRVREHGVRNSQFTTCQPTGTTALSCDASYGIEPIFGLIFEKKLVEGDVMKIVNPIFLERVKDEEWWNDGMIEKIFENGGSLKGIHGIPGEIRDVFITAHDIKPKDRIDMQAHIQKHCSTAISSTVNLQKETTAGEIAELYKYAWRKGLKGLTIYRDGSKKDQPVTFRKEKTDVVVDIHETIKNLKIERPKRLSGETHTVETGNGKMYVTINSSNKKPVEVFIEVGKAGQTMKVMSEALGRIVSIALQHRVPVNEVIKTLKGLDSSSPVWYRFEEDDQKPVQIFSIPDGLAQLLERYYINIDKNELEFLNGSSLSACIKCGIRAYLETEGCGVCQNCGFSNCS